ncbi:MAG: hypothetical protein CTY17_06655 [Methylomonas sp.]|nr:MAG: hypothetical protein CTY23_09435 [Methylomonas sp.]PPD40369.1 MAG: hypothetical protein CTY17_06655 [Methylomonas sp.]PPD55447.1 MAG: hypothetical protein CTY11_01555 [Methylomonas sp.]
MKNTLTIRQKLITSFSVLLLIILAFGLLSGFYIGRLGDSINDIAEWKVPAVKLAVEVHAGAYDATIEQLNYLLHESDEAYARARQVLNKMQGDLKLIDEIGHRFNDAALLRQSQSVSENVRDFGALYQQGVAALQSNRQAVEAMNTSGQAVLAEADAFAAKQEREYAQLLNSGANQAALNDKVQKYILVNRIKSLAQTIIQHEKEERLYKDRRFYQRMQQELPNLMALYDLLAAMTQDRSELDRIDKARSETEKYQKAAGQWIANDDNLKQIVAKMDAIATSARQSAADAELDGWRKAEEIAQATAGLVTQANTIIATFLLVGCAIAIGLVVTIPTGIIRPIKRLSAFAKAFGQGDLTERAQLATRDEIGSMAGDFDQAANNIQGIVSNVRQHAENLHVNAVQLLQSVEATVEGNQTQQTYIEQVATAMEQMAVAVREVADNALMAANAAAEMDVQSKTGLDTVQQAVDAIHALSAEIATAGDTVSDLESHVNNISGILDVIRSVSEQTNLLALNAAIEAARAGEHGRGFAVVADEVRTLASLTQSSTSDIQGMIEKLQTGSKKAVAAMDASRTLSQQSVDKALASGEILNAINVAVSGVNSMNAQIAASAEQQNLVTQDVNRNAIKITEIAETNVVRANASLRSSEALGYIASDLQVAMSRFKV